MTRLPLVTACAALAVTLASCASAGSSSLVPASTNDAAPDVVSDARPAKGDIRITINVPNYSTPAHRSKFVSPATQSMILTVVKGKKTVRVKVVNLTAASPGCKASKLGVTCTAMLRLKTGRYVVSVATYDALNGTGSELSAAQNVAFKLRRGKLTTLAVTLAGIPANIFVSEAGTNAIYVLAQDADGNFIVGPGAPAFAAALTSGNAVTQITQPTGAKPNEIDFAPASPPVTGSETIGITASYRPGVTNACALPAAVCSKPSAVTASFGQTLFTGNYGGSNILGFTVPIASASASPRNSLPIVNPYSIALDQNDDLFSASYSAAGSLIEYAPPYSTATAVNPNGVNNPYWVTLDASDDVFVANTGNSTITEYPAPYTAAPTTIASDISTPYAVAFDSSKTMYVANVGDGSLAILDPPYATAVGKLSTHNAPLSLIVSGNDLFVGETGAIEVFTLPVTPSSTPFATLTNGVIDCYGMMVDGSGNLYETNYSGASYGTIAEFTKPFSSSETPAFTIVENKTGTNTYYPYGILFDGAGNMYVANISGGLNSGGINVYSPPFTSASVPAIALTGNEFSQPYYLALTKSSTLSISY